MEGKFRNSRLMGKYGYRYRNPELSGDRADCSSIIHAADIHMNLKSMPKFTEK